MYGNKALRYSTYEAFKLITQIENETKAESIVQEYKRQGKIGILSSNRLKENKQNHNLVMGLMNMKIAIRVWKEYALLYDQFVAREGGIVSDDEIARFIQNQRSQEMKFYDFVGEGQDQMNKLKQGKSQLATFHSLYRALLGCRLKLTLVYNRAA